MVTFMVLYPFGMFVYLLYDGFNPYDELTMQEKKMKGHNPGIAGMVYLARQIFHWFLLIVVIYFLLMILLTFCMRHTRRYPGHHLWFIRKLGYMPYGALFFQEGEYFDCGICMGGIWKE